MTTKTLYDYGIHKNQVVSVCHHATGERGFAAFYGRQSWGGEHISVYRTEQDARDADVSDDDDASKVIDRHVENSRPRMQSWNVIDWREG